MSVMPSPLKSPVPAIVQVVGTVPTIADEMMHDRAGYTPFAGRSVQGWPTTVLSRGRVLVDDGKLSVQPGSGQFMPRSGGEAAKPTGRLVADMDPKTNFGATLL